MTVPVKIPVIEYLEDGATLSFPFPFQFNDPSDLILRRRLPGGLFADLDPSSWSAIGAGVAAGGSVILEMTVAGATLKIRRNTTIKQTASFPPLQPFPARSNEGALDRGTLIAQDMRVAVDDTISRAALAPEGEAIGPLPRFTARISKLPIWNSAADFDALAGDPTQQTIVTLNPGSIPAAMPLSAITGAAGGDTGFDGGLDDGNDANPSGGIFDGGQDG